MLFREIMFYCENHTKHTYTVIFVEVNLIVTCARSLRTVPSQFNVHNNNGDLNGAEEV